MNDVNALDPTSPEASAARGRMRDYEEQQRAAAAAVARRERVGPSARRPRSVRRSTGRRSPALSGRLRRAMGRCEYFALSMIRRRTCPRMRLKRSRLSSTPDSYEKSHGKSLSLR